MESISAPVLEAKSNPKKLPKKCLIIILSFLFFSFFVVAGIFIYRTLKKPLAKKEVLITEAKWKKAQKDLKESYIFKTFEKQLTNSKTGGLVKDKKSDVKTFYSSINRALYIPSLNSSPSMSSGLNSSVYAEEKKSITFLSKIRLLGQFNNPTSDKLENYEFFLSEIGIFNPQNAQAQADIIINGKAGDLILGNRDFDALHLSLIQPNLDTSYLNISMDDMLLVFINSLVQESSPSGEKKGLIFVDNEQIYPYLEKYMQIKSEPKEDFPPQIINYLNEYQSFAITAFEETIGNVDSFATKNKAYEDILAGKEIVRVEVSIDKNRFFGNLAEFFKKIALFGQQHQKDYSQFCESTDTETKEECWRSFGYFSENELQQLTNLEKLGLLVDFEQFDFLLDRKSQEFLGIDLIISINELVLKQLPVKTLKIELTYQNLLAEPYLEINEPLNYVYFSDGETKQFTAKQIPESLNLGQKTTEELFTKNHGFVQEIWNKDLEKSALKILTPCQDAWEPKFCFQMGDNWQVDEDEIEQYLSLSYPHEQMMNLRGKRIKIEFTNEGDFYDSLCHFEDNWSETKYSQYKNLKTADGLNLRIAKIDLKGTNQSVLEEESFVVDVCYQNPSGYYTKSNPYAKGIMITTQNLDFNEVSARLTKILSTLKFKDLQTVDLNKDYSDAFNAYKTVYLEGAKEASSSCSVQATENIKKDFNISEALQVVMKEGTVFCIRQDTCLVCQNGTLNYQELSNCKGLSCNP